MVLDTPNPQAERSLLPQEVADLLSVKLDHKDFLEKDVLSNVVAFRRAANYLAASMIFLKENSLLERELRHSDIKPRLLGHWGTCPGLTLVYAHLNLLIRRHDLDCLYVVGPGHGAPAILASLWLEGSLGHYDEAYSRTRKGLDRLVYGFSTPTGFPSHVTALTPGSIHEGGELGYALAVSWGAVMDKRDLVVCCVVGDGEAETATMHASWQGHKYIDPAESGAVIPIVHVNKYKIANPTQLGTMDDAETTAYFAGHGYQTVIVRDLDNIDDDLACSLEWAHTEIKKIQAAARGGKPIVKPRWPLIVLQSPKGWTGPQKVEDQFVEGTFRSHQVPLMTAAKDDTELEQLQDWLGKYHVSELITPDGQISEQVRKAIPDNNAKLLGRILDKLPREPLSVPDWRKYAHKIGTQESCMRAIGVLLDSVANDNKQGFRIFSPDELASNKLDAVLDNTARNFQWDETTRGKGGQVIEILSENLLHGMLQGYLLTGRSGLFPSYESFASIAHTMLVQYEKFIKQTHETTWRKPVNSINYIVTSTFAEQFHNGYSHQNPSVIQTFLNLKPQAARVYFPADANTFLSSVAHCLRSKNYANLLVGSKQPKPVFLSADEADAHCRAGASVWKFCSTDDGLDPDVVLCGIGSEMTLEVVSAASILRRLAPALRVRVVNVNDLMVLGQNEHPHSFSETTFEALFTTDRPVLFNYHGYHIDLGGMLFGRRSCTGARMSIACYREEGTTTTMLDLMMRNKCSRFDVLERAVLAASARNDRVKVDLPVLLGEIGHARQKCKDFINAEDKDPDGMFDTPTFEDTESFSPSILRQGKPDRNNLSTKDFPDFWVN
ncbi:hypothetical protein PYCC9005_003875 [Savitreella phatthalungensis]